MGQTPSFFKQAPKDQTKSLETRDGRGWTPLMRACWEGDVETAKRLLEAGASTDAVDNAGRTPLMIATERNNSDVVQLFSVKDRKKPKGQETVVPSSTPSFATLVSFSVSFVAVRPEA